MDRGASQHKAWAADPADHKPVYSRPAVSRGTLPPPSTIFRPRREVGAERITLCLSAPPCRRLVSRGANLGGRLALTDVPVEPCHQRNGRPGDRHQDMLVGGVLRA